MLAQRQAVFNGQVEKRRQRLGIAMQIVVRVQMGGRTTHQFFKAGELLFQLIAQSPARVSGGFFQFIAKIRVQADAHFRRAATQLGCLSAPGRVDEQTRAGQNAALVGFQDAAVDTATGAEIIRVDD